MSSTAVSEVPQSFQEEMSAELAPSMTNSDRVAEFHAFVAQNADVLGESDRSSGFKAPIGLLVKMCPVEVTEENVDTFYAEVRGMVARAQQEVETTDETAEVKAEEASDETEREAEDKGKIAQPLTTLSEKESGELEQVKKLSGTTLSEITVQPKPVESTNSNSEAGPIQPESTALNTTKESNVSSGATMRTSEISGEETSGNATEPDNQPQKKVPELKNKIHMTAKTINDGAEKPGITTVTASSDTKESNTSDAQTFEPKAPAYLAEIEIVESPVVLETIKIEDESEKLPYQTFVEQDSNSLETSTASVVTESKVSETATVTTEKVEDETLDLEQNETDRLLEPVISTAWEEDNEVYISSEIVLGSDLLQTETERPTHNYMRLEAPEPVLKLSLPLEEIGPSVWELAERIEALEDEESQAVYDILDKIIAESEEVDFSAYDTEDQEQFQDVQGDREEELKDLFIKLFDLVEVDYTPELLESFTKLAIRGNIVEFTEVIESDEEDKVITDRGTHEAITKLLAAATIIKKAARHSYRIGKSTLRLYAQQLASA